MKDNVLGELVYNGGWCKEEMMQFWNADLEIRIVFSAYENEQVNSSQMASYKYFKEDIESISRLSMKKLQDYIECIEEDILAYGEINVIPEDIFKLVRITQILFLENGAFAILCNAIWDEHGVAVLCTEDEMVAGPQNIVWTAV